MLNLQEWNTELAQVAQNYAELCIFGHNSDRSIQSPSFSYIGENIAITTASGNYTNLVRNWYDEVQNYNYATNQCNGVCGHYTQVSKYIYIYKQ